MHIGDLTSEAANDELVNLALGRHGRLDAIYNVAGLVKFFKGNGFMALAPAFLLLATFL